MNQLVKWGIVLLVSPAFPILAGSVGGVLVNSTRIYIYASQSAEFCLFVLTPFGALLVLVGVVRTVALKSRPRGKAQS